MKLLPPDALILAQNAPKCVWRPGSARTRWGSLSAPPKPLAAKRGLLLRGGEGREGGEGGKGKVKGEERGGEGLEGGKEGEGGKGPPQKFQAPPPKKSWLRPC